VVNFSTSAAKLHRWTCSGTSAHLDINVQYPIRRVSAAGNRLY